MKYVFTMTHEDGTVKQVVIDAYSIRKAWELLIDSNDVHTIRELKVQIGLTPKEQTHE